MPGDGGQNAFHTIRRKLDISKLHKSGQITIQIIKSLTCRHETNVQDLYHTVHQPRKHVLDDADHTAPNRQHDLEHTDSKKLSVLPGRSR